MRSFTADDRADYAQQAMEQQHERKFPSATGGLDLSAWVLARSEGRMFQDRFTYVDYLCGCWKAEQGRAVNGSESRAIQLAANKLLALFVGGAQ